MTQQLAYTSKNAWQKYNTELDRLKLAELAREYIDFLNTCKTERETILHVYDKLQRAGFTQDASTDKVVIPLREKALFAAVRGSANPGVGFNLIAAHADSPRLDFKQHPFIEQAGIVQAKTHYYGGIRKYQWLARELAIHGVIALENGQKVVVNIGEAADEPVFCIADLLPHLAKKQGQQKLSEAFEAEKLNIILGHMPHEESDSDDENEKTKNPIREQILNKLNSLYNIKEEDLITAELEAVPAGSARFVGFDQSLIGGYGQDDRICVFCALNALLEASVNNPGRNLALMIWDKEEIGSDGATGASSKFMEYCMEDVAKAWGEKSLSKIMLNTRAISADVTASLDPDYQDVHEKQNAALIGHGPCFSKYTGSGGKYGASEADAEFYASVRAILNKAAIPWQAAELGKVDSGGGGTVALFLAAQGMNVIDLGPALLSMHSPFEISSVADLYATREAYREFLLN